MRNGFFSLYFLLCKVRVFLIRGCFAAGLGLNMDMGWRLLAWLLWFY